MPERHNIPFMPRTDPRRITAALLASGLRVTLTVEIEAEPTSRPVVETTGITLPDEPPASRPGLARCARVVSISAARRTA